MHIPTAYHWGSLFRNKTSLNLASALTVGGASVSILRIVRCKGSEECHFSGFILFKGHNCWSTFCQSNSTPHDSFFRISVAIVFLFHDALCSHVLVVVTLESVIYDVTKSSTSVLQVAWHWQQLDPWAARWLSKRKHECSWPCTLHVDSQRLIIRSRHLAVISGLYSYSWSTDLRWEKFA